MSTAPHGFEDHALHRLDVLAAQYGVAARVELAGTTGREWVVLFAPGNADRPDMGVLGVVPWCPDGTLGTAMESVDAVAGWLSWLAVSVAPRGWC